MKDVSLYVGCTVMLVAIMVVISAVSDGAGHDRGYVEGQIDAINGKQSFVKLKDADGREYVVKKEGK